MTYLIQVAPGRLPENELIFEKEEADGLLFLYGEAF